jgi:hypothetical protein
MEIITTSTGRVDVHTVRTRSSFSVFASTNPAKRTQASRLLPREGLPGVIIGKRKTRWALSVPHHEIIFDNVSWKRRTSWKRGAGGDIAMSTLNCPVPRRGKAVASPGRP